MADNLFSPTPYSQKIEKPWGYEIIVTPSGSPFVGKIAFTYAGKRWSLQYHDQKEEALTLISGKAKLLLDDENGQLKEIQMEPQRGYSIKPLQKHRFVAETDCLTMEVSTPEKGNTFRLEDDYQRGNEDEAIRNLPDRSWQKK